MSARPFIGPLFYSLNAARGLNCYCVKWLVSLCSGFNLSLTICDALCIDDSEVYLKLFN